MIDFDAIEWKDIRKDSPTEWSDNGYLLKTYGTKEWVTDEDGKHYSIPSGTCRIYRGGVHPWMTMAWANELLFTDEKISTFGKLQHEVGHIFENTYHIGPITYFYAKYPGEHPEATFIDQSKDL